MRETKICVEPQLPQGVLVCEHAGLIINEFKALSCQLTQVRALIEVYDINRSGALDSFEFEHMVTVQGTGFRVQGSGFRVQGTGFRVQGTGFKV